ncbi:MAG: hypothetical protein ACHQEB_04980 [Chitinophagales bacterium]
MIYGVVFFCLNNFFDELNPALGKKIYQSLYTFLEYFVFAFLLWSNIQSKRLRIIIILLSGFFVAFQIIYYLIATKWRLDTLPIGVETILIFIYIFFFFFQYFKITQSEYVYNEPCFWVATGIMLYLGGTFFFYILANHIPKAERDQYWYLTYIVETMKNILFAVAVFIYSRKPNENKKKILPYLDLDFSFTDSNLTN